MESSPGIFFKGYPYFQEKFEEKQKNILHTHLLFKKAIVLKGEEAAKIFYDREKFIRKGATPARFKKTLLGEGGVQGLDHQEHLHRKKMFMKVMGPSSLEEIKQLFEKYWIDDLKEWQKEEEIVLFKESEKVLFKTACEWTGVPLPANPEEAANYFSNMIDGSGGIGIRHWRGRRGRNKVEKWMKKLVSQVRKGKIQAQEDSILHYFSLHKDPAGNLLPEHVVAVELMNLIRPIVAIARYIVFAAHALESFPQYKQRLLNDTNELDLHFVQEVRRYYPFFPFVAAKVENPFDWQQTHFPKGRRVLLDLYATTHDKETWAAPNTFYAERFMNWDGSAFNFIPQGGGDHHQNHRCAGEWITIDLTRLALDFLLNKMAYKVPEQDLEIDMSRIPAIPKSRFKMTRVKEKI